MTISRFQKLLKIVNPKLRIRFRGPGDVGGIFAGMSGKSGYIARVTKGELQLNGFRMLIVNPNNKMELVNKGIIKKRGRKTLINLLRNWGWIKHPWQVSMLSWGIDPERLHGKVVNDHARR